MIITALVFLIILSLLVLIHEAGHFFTAKHFGIKVEEFGFGLPPRIWGIQRGETLYSLNWLPIGGFVKLYGEDDAGSGIVRVPAKAQGQSGDINRAFYARSPLQRALVIVAGVVMNVILAIVIYYVFLGISGFKTQLPLLDNFHFIGVNQTVNSDLIISQVAKNSPAAGAHLVANSRLLSINSLPVQNAETVSSYIKSHAGTPIILKTQDLTTNKKTTSTVVPRLHPPKNQGALGIAFFSANTVTLSYDTPLQRIFSGIIHPINLMWYQFDVMAKLIAVSVHTHNATPISQGVSGPVGIFSLVGNILQIPDMKERILQILNLAGLLSMSLAFFNILPIPALDGGRFFFILIELIFRKKVNPRIEGYAHAIGMAVLLTLILLITLKDIGQLFIK